ncbi:MAG TPA: polysaccharide deacetylase family protein [Candidatus Binatia bacterium]|nr:polysaccharide deacetylase family protein [Candidatus Binatia bacterium]
MTLRGAPVLMYDGLGTSPPADVDARLAKYWVSPGSFGRQLALIRERGHRVVRLYDVWAGPEDERPASPPVVLTFDDGRAADYEVAFPLLLAAGVRAEFFVNTATIGQPGYLTWSRIAEMHRAGMSFQSHSHDHVTLPGLPARLLKSELQTSKRLIEDRVGRGVDFLAAPHGLVDRRVVNAAREVGYLAVCAALGWPTRPGGVVVNRVAVYRHTTEARFRAILARQPWSYLPGVTRAVLTRLPRRVVLKVRPQQVHPGLSLRGA